MVRHDAVRIALGVCAMVAAAAAAQAGPRLDLPRDEHDAGAVARGAVIAARFELQNRGDETLVITRVEPG